MIVVMKDRELFFIKKEKNKFNIYNNKKTNVGTYYSEDEIEWDLNNKKKGIEVINVNNDYVEQLHQIIYDHIDKKYIDEYFIVSKDLEPLMPFGFFYQPQIINIAVDFVKKANNILMLNYPPLKYFELMDYSINVFNSETLGGYGKMALPDLIITFIEQSFGAIKSCKNVDTQILNYFYLINATIPREHRLSNDEFFDFYFDWLGKNSKFNNGVLKFILNEPKPILYFQNIINTMENLSYD